MNNKVSVIVPVYNVENFLDKCVSSLLNQTVSGYDIILVDDGSTDNSGKKCDKWALKSNLITVLHKINGGLSDARNYGVDHTNAEYVTFVDSDDYVEPTYIEMLIGGLTHDVDMVITHHIQEYEWTLQKPIITRNYEIYSAEEALKKMCYEEISTSACGKLIPKCYVEKDCFPEGKLYEDLLTMYKYIGRSCKIAYNGSQTYHYVQRSGSIRQGKWNPRSFDVMEGASDLLRYIDKNYPELHSSGVFRYFYSANELYVRAFSSAKYLDVIKPIREYLRKNLKTVVVNRETSIKYRMQFCLMVVNPTLYKLVWIKNKGRSYNAK